MSRAPVQVCLSYSGIQCITSQSPFPLTLYFNADHYPGPHLRYLDTLKKNVSTASKPDDLADLMSQWSEFEVTRTKSDVKVWAAASIYTTPLYPSPSRGALALSARDHWTMGHSSSIEELLVPLHCAIDQRKMPFEAPP